MTVSFARELSLVLLLLLVPPSAAWRLPRAVPLVARRVARAPLLTLAESELATASSATATNAAASQHRAGFVSIIGLPNVGKSTLMNALVGEKLSITCSKAQTTRHRIMGILSGDDYQIVYSDTPGVIPDPSYKLQEGMMGFVRSSINDADVLLVVVDVFQDGFADERVLRQLRASPAALLVLLNKVDLLDEAAPRGAERRAKLGAPDELRRRWEERFPEATVLPIAARRGEGVDEVLRTVRALLPVHPPFFPADQMSDKPERFFASEMLRQAIFEGYQQEVRDYTSPISPLSPPSRPPSISAIHIRAGAVLVRGLHRDLQGEREAHPSRRHDLRLVRVAEGHRHRQAGRRAQAGGHAGARADGALLGEASLPGDPRQGPEGLAAGRGGSARVWILLIADVTRECMKQRNFSAPRSELCAVTSLPTVFTADE